MRKIKEKKFCITCRIRIEENPLNQLFNGGKQYVEYEDGYKCLNCEAKFRK